jgi:glycerol-3-phosphate dehydrogenase
MTDTSLSSDIDIDIDVDLLVIGGGVNGTGIARDAAGRGLSVMLVERDDLASHTSSSSTKLITSSVSFARRSPSAKN